MGDILFTRVIGPVCKSETVGKVGEVDEKGERELVLVRHDTWIADCFRHTKMCNPLA